jgi:hypothetical protein
VKFSQIGLLVISLLFSACASTQARIGSNSQSNETSGIVVSIRKNDEHNILLDVGKLSKQQSYFVHIESISGEVVFNGQHYGSFLDKKLKYGKYLISISFSGGGVSKIEYTHSPTPGYIGYDISEYAVIHGEVRPYISAPNMVFSLPKFNDLDWVGYLHFLQIKKSNDEDLVVNEWVTSKDTFSLPNGEYLWRILSIPNWAPKNGATSTLLINSTVEGWSNLSISEDHFDILPKYFDVQTKVPTVLQYREDLRGFGQYEVVDVDYFSSELGCLHVQEASKHIIKCAEKSIEWLEGTNVLNFPSSVNNFISLPLQPFYNETQLFFPIRILAESLGFNTLFHKKEKQVEVFSLKRNMRYLDLVIDETISGSDINFSYFLTAHETKDYYYLIYDHSHSIIKFNKADFSYEKLTADEQYGFLYEFVIANDNLYVATSKGLILHWNINKFDVLTGNGDIEIVNIGGKTDFSQFKSHFINKLVANKVGVLYFQDHLKKKIYSANLNTSIVTLLSDVSTIDGILDMGVYNGSPTFVQKDNKFITIDPDNFSITKNSCMEALFGVDEHRIYSAYFHNLKDIWIVLSAGSRTIFEVSMPFDDENQVCEIILATFTGDETAFLNGFGSIDNDIDNNRVLAIDSDGFNLVSYTIGGDVKLVTKEVLGSKASTTFLAPMSVAENEGDLYILSNNSQRVFKYSLIDKQIEAYLGTGKPTRNSKSNVHRLEVPIGYSSQIKFDDNKLLVADHFNRRMLYEEADIAYQLFPPVHWEYMGGIVGFDVDDGKYYLVDHTSGMLLYYVVGYSKPRRFAGFLNSNWTSNSESVRRAESKKSIHNMNDFDSVTFGLPQSVVVLPNNQMAVSDLYRNGIWLLNLDDESVKPLAGLNSRTDYHFGSITANVGLNAKEIRLGSPLVLEYDMNRDIIVVGGGYSQSIIFILSVFSKTCEAKMDVPVEFIRQGLFLNDGRLAVVDARRNAVHIFKKPDLTCLESGYYITKK